MRRYETGDCYWHVFARGTRRLALYYEDQDFREFLMFVKEALIVSGCLLYGYSLMDNHYHLILRGTQAQLTRCMWRINWRYALYHNGKYRMGGHVFDGPYNAFRQKTFRYLLWRLAYVFLNPVVAGKAVRPEDYRWSGYSSFLDLPGSPLEVTPLSDLAAHLDSDDAFETFRLILDEQRSRRAKKEPGTPTAREINLLQFGWLRHRAEGRCATLPKIDPISVAMYWGRQVGIPPRVMASAFQGLDGKSVSGRIRRFMGSLEADAELRKLLEQP